MKSSALSLSVDLTLMSEGPTSSGFVVLKFGIVVSASTGIYLGIS